MAAPTVRSVGATSTPSVATTITVPTPTIVAGDVLVAVIEVGLASSCSASGWTQAFRRSQVAVSGTTVLYAMTRIADGTEGASVVFTFVGSINHATGQMVSIQNHGCATVADIVVDTTGNGGAAATTGTANGITVTADSLVLIIAGTALDATSSAVYSAWTNANLASITEQLDACVLTGNGGGYGMATGSCAGTTTGSSTWTQTSEAWNGTHLGIKPAAGGAVALAGQADGVSTADAALTGAVPLAGQADGISTADAALTGAVPLAGQADGTSTADAALTGAVPLVGQADGTSTADGALTTAGGGAVALTGQADGTSSADAALTGAVPLAGQADGISTATGALTGAVPLAGQADGVSTATAALTGAVPVAGQADGVATADGSLTIAGTVDLAGQADGISTATGVLTGAVPLAGQSDGISTADAALTAAGPAPTTGPDFFRVELVPRWEAVLEPRWDVELADARWSVSMMPRWFVRVQRRWETVGL